MNSTSTAHTIQERQMQREYVLRELVPRAKTRTNGLPEALGNLRRFRFLCWDLVVSPDHSSYYIVTIVTLGIVALNFAVSSSMWTLTEVAVCVALLLAAFTSSFLVTTTDPGVYPRLLQGEVDPLEMPNNDLVYCRYCSLRRPPQVSHCHICNVCVLNHDHHCSILGGCIGLRSLRFFVTYLVCISSALSVGIYWIIKRIYITFVLTAPFREQRMQSPSTTPLPLHHNTTGRTPREADMSNLDLMYIPAMFVLVVDVIVLMLVGTFSLMYIYFFLTAITRRESQRGDGVRKTWRRLLRCPVVCSTLYSNCFPPPSLLVAPRVSTDLV